MNGSTQTAIQRCRYLIVGGGTWGLAIAYNLAKRGYAGIKVLDGQDFPPSIAAGNDLNKIMEEPEELPSDNDEDDVTHAWRVIESTATNVWKTDPIYQPHYHPTGFIYAAAEKAGYEKVRESVKAHPENWTELSNAQAFHQTMPNGVLTGDFSGWKGFLRKRNAGWVAARETMKDLHAECIKLGVDFQTNITGRVTELLCSDKRTDIIGARTADGTAHHADRIILSAEASSDLLLDFQKQLRPTAWTLAHLPLTPEEAMIYKNLPVLYCVDRGFFIEPDAASHEIKLCDEHPGYINLIKTDQRERSVPFAKEQIPIEASQRMRTFLHETMPHLADRRFTYARICWDADTPNRLFLIGQHPEYESLTVAVGGSGHGFMCSPAVGVIVADLLEGTLDERLKRTLGWRPATAVGRDWWDTQGRFGADGRVMGLEGSEGWTGFGD